MCMGALLNHGFCTESTGLAPPNLNPLWAVAERWLDGMLILGILHPETGLFC